MNIELTGTIKSVGPIEKPTETFSKRDVVITIDEDTKYPQVVVAQAVQDTCAKLDELRPGDSATLTCNLRGNEYKDKVYISLQLWKFSINQTTAQPQQATQSNIPDDLPSDMPF
mgnify:CR=1 FL=1